MRVRCRATGCPKKWSRRRMTPVLIIAGELVGRRGADRGRRGTRPVLDGTSSVRAPHVAKPHTTE